MRNISFMLTEDQVRDRTKTVTRRLGWANLQPGTLLRGVRKAMGLKNGEKAVPIAVIRVEDVRREPLHAIDHRDVVREGFPAMHPEDFIRMFGEHMRVDRDAIVTRIEFSYVYDAEGRPIPGGEGEVTADNVSKAGVSQVVPS